MAKNLNALAVPPTVRVCYHAGPAEIGYFHRHWVRGQAQEIPMKDWSAMQDRSDFNEFEFKEEAP